MGIVLITSTINCDDCGAQFRVEIDAAYSPPKRWSMADVAEDAVRGGSFHSGSNWCQTDANICSVRADKLLCPKCTERYDADNPEADAHYITDAIDRAEAAEGLHRISVYTDMKCQVVSAACGICALQELELLQRLEGLYVSGYQRGRKDLIEERFDEPDSDDNFAVRQV